MSPVLYDKVIIYKWPTSQICSECVSGEFVQSGTYYSSNYICKKGCTRNDGVHCPDHVSKG